jgi:hypothetical protein
MDWNVSTQISVTKYSNTGGKLHMLSWVLAMEVVGCIA